ncbi:hypothetical protein GCM10009801_44340 [Streptomyces albiaxialis]|uniref:DUF3995 domain-containing protein n=1 Tax=Streptomyces albiaxialis TaxID=329523 RepID=A0ABP5HPE3_9ACTN
MTATNEAAESAEGRTAALRDTGAALWKLSAGIVTGALAGLLVCGVGGRLVMYLLRFTSPDSSMGKTTDAKSTIGEWSLQTFGLLETGIAMGAQVGALYILVRPWLAEGNRHWKTAVFGATAGGAMFIRPDGVDYYAVKPLWLTVPLFILLPALFGYLLADWTERLLASGKFGEAPAWQLWVPVVLVAPAVWHITREPALVLLLVSTLLATFLRGRAGAVVRVWRAPVTRWTGSRLLFVLGLANIYVIVTAVHEIAGKS